MSFFKDQLEEDLSAVFLNPEEFGEICEIAGHKDVAAVISSLELEMPPAGVDDPGAGFEGVEVAVAASSVPDRLLPNRRTTFNGEEWFVLSTSEEMGLRMIRLYRERT